MPQNQRKDSAAAIGRYLISHTAHDYRAIVARWKSVAASSNLRFDVIAEQAGYRVYGLRTRSIDPGCPAMYASAGCHGDEPAAVLGLLEWAEQNIEVLAQRPVVIFPCLNPWGLVHNSRYNHQGLDLNRQFHDEMHPLIVGWRAFIQGLHFPVSVTLHEDYDATGIYLYELNPRVGHSYGEPLLQRCEKVIPREWRTSIEGRKAVNAIVRRTRGLPKLEGMPEAVTLFAEQGGAALTFETPSEFSLFDRVQAHRIFVASLFTATT